MRADGRRMKTLDPLFAIVPHLMPKRYDAQVMGDVEINYSILRKYISQKAEEGIKISFMSIYIAAYLRMVCHVPALNRFVMNKNIYARKEFCVSFALLKTGEVKDDKIETVVKLKFELTDTIFDVAKKVEDAIAENRKVAEENMADKLAKFFVGIPIFSRCIISLAKGCDKIGLLPKLILDASPFHTSIFITNMASINMGKVYHHIYEFGSTSVFVSFGKLYVKADDKGSKTLIIPLSCVVDERICAGVTFSKAYSCLRKYLSNPSLLEAPPTEINQDIK